MVRQLEDLANRTDILDFKTDLFSVGMLQTFFLNQVSEAKREGSGSTMVEHDLLSLVIVCASSWRVEDDSNNHEAIKVHQGNCIGRYCAGPRRFDSNVSAR